MRMRVQWVDVFCSKRHAERQRHADGLCIILTEAVAGKLASSKALAWVGKTVRTGKPIVKHLAVGRASNTTLWLLGSRQERKRRADFWRRK